MENSPVFSLLDVILSFTETLFGFRNISHWSLEFDTNK